MPYPAGTVHVACPFRGRGGGGRTRSVRRFGVRTQVLEMAARLALVQLVPANHQSTERTVACCRRASVVPRRDCEVLTSNSVCRVGGMRLLNVGGSRRNRRCRRSLVIRTGTAAREDTSKRQHRHRAPIFLSRLSCEDTIGPSRPRSLQPVKVGPALGPAGASGLSTTRYAP